MYSFSWSHFRALIHLPTPEQFRHYADLASEHGWTTRQLKKAIDVVRLQSTRNGVRAHLEPDRPRLWTYRVVGMGGKLLPMSPARCPSSSPHGRRTAMGGIWRT